MFLYFILGILFMEVCLPIIDELVAIVVSALEVIKGKYALKLTKINEEIQKISTEENSHAIGFMVPSEEDYEDEDYDD